jgi:curved DNA-binding protein CbpA
MSLSNLDPYKILKVARTATQEALKKAYRALALKLHPDRNPGDTKALEQMKQVNAAWVEVGTPEARARFDLFNPPAGRGRRTPSAPEPPPRPAQRPAAPPQPPPRARRRAQRSSSTEEAWEAARRATEAQDAAWAAEHARQADEFEAAWTKARSRATQAAPFFTHFTPFTPFSDFTPFEEPEPAQRAGICPICAGTNPSCNWCASR